MPNCFLIFMVAHTPPIVTLVTILVIVLMCNYEKHHYCHRLLSKPEVICPKLFKSLTKSGSHDHVLLSAPEMLSVGNSGSETAVMAQSQIFIIANSYIINTLFVLLNLII